MKLRVLAVAFAALSLGVVPALAHEGHDHGAAAAPQSAEGEGVVRALDAKTPAITLAHGPIAALKWPAMTMTFRVASASVLTGVSVGAKVRFTLVNDHGKPVVSQIHLM
jgi:Cu(I)/Ag(I) efflux system protein CusF